LDVTTTGNATAATRAPQGLGGAGPLSEDQRRRLEQLQARDRQVRAHEAAHLSAAGGLALSGAEYSYTRGPDGRLYAIGGEVHIDTSEVPNDPRATIAKAEVIHRAALAPADPSAQDQRVAAEADAMGAKTRQELTQQTARGAAKTLGGRPADRPTDRPADRPADRLRGRLQAAGGLPGGTSGPGEALHWVA
jgi:SprA-related family